MSDTQKELGVITFECTVDLGPSRALEVVEILYKHKKLYLREKNLMITYVNLGEENLSKDELDEIKEIEKKISKYRRLTCINDLHEITVDLLDSYLEDTASCRVCSEVYSKF